MFMLLPTSLATLVALSGTMDAPPRPGVEAPPAVRVVHTGRSKC